jgi:4-amino-4-deoxy-L-arabinose transferase-like glycosyltransferase
VQGEDAGGVEDVQEVPISASDRTIAPAGRPDEGRSRGVHVVAAVLVLVLLVLADRYGPHRDELYFIAAGRRHPQFGYPDQPPLTPLIAAGADLVRPGSLRVLLLVPALLCGLDVLLAAGLARDFGGGRRAQLLAALATAFGAGIWATGHLLSTTTVDLFFWVLIVRLVLRVLRRNEPRGWLLVGLATGLALQNKDLIAFGMAALVAGIAVTPSVRHHLRSPWLWAGGLLAVAIWSPYLVWQARHGWPQLTLAGQIRSDNDGPGGIAQLVLLQLVIVSIYAAVLIWQGLRELWRRPEWAYARPLAVAYPLLLVFFVVDGGKDYYTLGFLVPLAAVGAVVQAERDTPRQWRRFAVVLGLVALIPLPGMLPLLPASTLDGTPWAAVNPDALETVGWPGVVQQVRDVANGLPAGQRAGAVIVTSNYGEAGALLWYGAPLPVFSGHNGFGDWGPPATDGAVVFVGDELPPGDALRSCRRAGTLRTGVDDQEDGTAIWVCAGPNGGWASAWPKIRHLDA